MLPLFRVTAWKVSVFGVFLVRIFPHSELIRGDTNISPHRARMRENTDLQNSEYRHFSSSEWFNMKTETSKLDVLNKLYSHSHPFHIDLAQVFAYWFDLSSSGKVLSSYQSKFLEVWIIAIILSKIINLINDVLLWETVKFY